MQLGFVVSERYLLTIHRSPVEYPTDFTEQDKGETAIGQLSPAALAAALLDWLLTQFFEQVAEIEAAGDEIDQEVLGILVHLDDERGAATLDLLARFAETNQVLLFTHHKSVRDDARRLEEQGSATIVEINRMR